MNFKKKIIFGLSISFLLIITLSSCKKKKAFKDENAQISVDTRMFQGQTDQAMADINLAIMGQPLLRGRSSELSETTLEVICGLEQDTSLVYQGIFRLIYNGIPCHGVKRVGEVVVTFIDYPLSKWKNAGTNLKIDFIGYKCSWESNGQSIQLDGSMNLRNESGKTWYDLQFLNEPKLDQILTGNDIKITFSADNYTNISLNRRMEYTYSSSSKITTCKIDGLGSQDGESSLENWGFTRDGLKFTNTVNASIIWRTSCGAVAPIDGQETIKVEDKAHELKSTFSFDNQGNELVGDNPCPYGWRVEWSYKNKTNSRLFSFQ